MSETQVERRRIHDRHDDAKFRADSPRTETVVAPPPRSPNHMTPTPKDPATPLDARRRFLARFGALIGASTLGTSTLGASSTRTGTSEAPSAAGRAAPNNPLVHAADAWMNALPSGHRMVWDAFTTAGAVNAGRFCNNWIASNGSGYDLKPTQLGAIIVLRSLATVTAFTDAMWAKYPLLGQQLRSTDPTTNKPYTINPFMHPERGDTPAQGISWAPLVAQGVHFAVCAGTTAGLVQAIAASQSLSADAVLADLVANQVGNAHQMATGIVALGRAQEKGFTYGGGA